MCVCDDKNIGNEVILNSAERPFCQDETEFLDVAICRRDKWTAEIHAWTTLGSSVLPVFAVTKAINYCPLCGRRLSLGDAGRRG